MPLAAAILPLIPARQNCELTEGWVCDPGSGQPQQWVPFSSGSP